jgi:hypothetical protein
VARRKDKADRIDPEWPAGASHSERPISELAADRQGSLSPFGDEDVPVPPERLRYEHPQTVINR